MTRLRWISTCALVVGFVSTGPFCLAALAQPAEAERAAAAAAAIDPKVDALVKGMTAYLTGLPAFTVSATNTMQVILTSGQKLDFEAVSSVTVRRPDRIRTRREGVAVNADFYYDGKTVTVFDRTTKFYTQNDAPPTIDELLGVLQSLLGVEVPGGDLLYTDAYEGLMADVLEAHVVGVADIGGVKTHHLAFRGKEVDFQIWIEDADKPLPRRYVITTKWMTGAPQFGVTLSGWNVSPQIDDKTFVFEPPAGARRVDVLKPTLPGSGR